jgi:hypothetical protein
MQIILPLVDVPDDRIRPGEPMNFSAGGFHCIDPELVQFKLAVRMFGIGVEVKAQCCPVVFGEGFAGGVLKKLVTQATPESDNDHLRAILIIIADQN